jgi:hypothetical protein
MSSFYDLASLVMIPSGKKAGKVYSQKPLTTDGQLDFTRASTATRIGSDGKIEKTRKNSFLQSNQFDTTWTATSVTLTSGQAGYDGTNNAWSLTDTTGLGEHRLVQNSGLVGIITISVYAKANTLDFIFLRGVNSSANKRAWFNLSTGSVGTQEGIEAKMTSVGNGWYRCSFTLDHQSGFEQYIGTSNANGVASYAGSEESVYIQNAQVEAGLVATDYIDTTTAAVSVGSVDNMPRLNYTPGSATSCPSLLLEPQRTNLIDHSEYIEGLTINYGAATSNVILSPEGVINGSKVTPNTSAQRSQISELVLSVGTTYTLSIFVKYNDLQYLYISNAGAGSTRGIFDIQNGTKISKGADVDDYNIESYGNGWYRCSVTYEAQYTTVYYTFSPNSNNAVWTSSGEFTYVYGVSAEAGSYATSYIPTFGATVTRVADACSKTGITSLIGQTAGTMFVEVENNPTAYLFSAPNNVIFASINAGSYLENFHFTTDDASVYVYVNAGGGVLQAKIGTTLPTTPTLKMAVTYTASAIKFFLNGALVGTDTSFTLPSGMNRYEIGHMAGQPDSQRMRGNTKKFILFESALSDADAITLTTL